MSGAFLLVTELRGDEAVWLLDEDAGDGFEVSIDQVAAHTKLRWGLTLCSVQGRSLSGTIGIHDVNSRHFSDAHLYIALSRAIDGAAVSIVEGAR